MKHRLTVFISCPVLCDLTLICLECLKYSNRVKDTAIPLQAWAALRAPGAGILVAYIPY